MPDPSDVLDPHPDGHTRDPSQAPSAGRLRPLPVGRPHPKRRLRSWGGDGVVRTAACRLTRF